MNGGMSYSDSDSDSGPAPDKNEYIFANKKDAVEAFKNLLREKVSGTMAFVHAVIVVKSGASFMYILHLLIIFVILLLIYIVSSVK